nr:killer cell lectin-like receptor subfamily F member 1 [Pogona vitticeps]
MDDEEGYMTLSPRMPNETSSQESLSKRRRGNSKRVTQYKLSVGILGALCTILGSAAVVLLTFVLQGGFRPCETVNATKDNAGRLEDGPCFSQQVAVHLCEPFTEGATCKLCPANWKERRGKCYWFSREKKSWLVGYQDCSRKKAQLPVVYDAEEMGFIQQNVPEKSPVWIGLNFTPSVGIWTWIDGAALKEHLFPQIHQERETSCAILKGNDVRSEMCTADFGWMCEKRAIVL